MKKLVLLMYLGSFFMAFFISCDKIEQPTCKIISYTLNGKKITTYQWMTMYDAMNLYGKCENVRFEEDENCDQSTCTMREIAANGNK